jgi:hypothetical protein
MDPKKKKSEEQRETHLTNPVSGPRLLLTSMIDEGAVALKGRVEPTTVKQKIRIEPKKKKKPFPLFA